MPNSVTRGTPGAGLADAAVRLWEWLADQPITPCRPVGRIETYARSLVDPTGSWAAWHRQ